MHLSYYHISLFPNQDPPKTPPTNGSVEDHHPVEDLVNDTTTGKDQPPSETITVKSTELDTPKGRLVVTTTSEGTDLKQVVFEKSDGSASPQKPANQVDIDKAEKICRVTVKPLQ